MIFFRFLFLITWLKFHAHRLLTFMVFIPCLPGCYSIILIWILGFILLSIKRFAFCPFDRLDGFDFPSFCLLWSLFGIKMNEHFSTRLRVFNQSSAVIVVSFFFFWMRFIAFSVSIFWPKVKFSSGYSCRWYWFWVSHFALIACVPFFHSFPLSHFALRLNLVSPGRFHFGTNCVSKLVRENIRKSFAINRSGYAARGMFLSLGNCLLGFLKKLF